MGLPAIGAAALAALVPLTASGTPHQKLYLGVNLHFTDTTGTTTAGTFVASGAVNDAGTTAAENLAFVPIGNTDSAQLSGDEGFTSPNGTIDIHFDGVAFPLSSPHEVGKGRFRIVSGTDAYAGLRGQGTFTMVVDQTSNELVGTLEGSAGA
jgi:hypothetical protein